MKYICKRANRKYIPLWMYMIQALLLTLEGIINLFLLPFGYICVFTGSWSGVMLQHSINTRKHMKK